MLQATDPASGAVLESAPTVVTLTFNEPVALPRNSVRVLSAEGTDVETGPAKAVGHTVTIELRSQLGNGSYVVTWKALSADSHPVRGAFTFAVGAPTAPGAASAALAKAERANETSTAARVLVDAAVAIAYLGSLVAVGAAAFLVWLVPGGATSRTTTIRRVATASAIVGAVGLTLGVVAEAMLIIDGGVGFPSWSAIGDQVVSSTGLQAAIGCAGLLVIAVGAVPASRGGFARRAAAVLGSALVAFGFVLVGHTRTATPIGVTIAADLAHIVAAAVWSGGLISLLVFLRSNDGANADERVDDQVALREDASVVARFSGWAGVAIVAVMLGGSVLAWQIVGSWGDLLHTSWGVLMLVKVALFALVAGIGAYNRFALVGRFQSEDRHDVRVVRRRLMRTLRFEVVVILAVIVVTSVLTSASPVPPPTPSAPAAAQTCDQMRAMPGMGGMQCEDAPPASSTASGSFGTGTATVVVDPSRVGPNHVVVTLRDAGGAPIEPHSPPELTFRFARKDIGPFTATGGRVGDGRFAVTQDLVLAGEWKIEVAASVTEFDEQRASVTIRIGP